MVFNWVNDNGTSFDNITFYPEQLFLLGINLQLWEDQATQVRGKLKQ